MKAELHKEDRNLTINRHELSKSFKTPNDVSIITQLYRRGVQKMIKRKHLTLQNKQVALNKFAFLRRNEHSW